MAMVIINRGILIAPDLYQGNRMDRPANPLTRRHWLTYYVSFLEYLIVVLSCLGEFEEIVRASEAL
jgi:hypothetical protein